MRTGCPIRLVPDGCYRGTVGHDREKPVSPVMPNAPFRPSHKCPFPSFPQMPFLSFPQMPLLSFPQMPLLSFPQVFSGNPSYRPPPFLSFPPQKETQHFLAIIPRMTLFAQNDILQRSHHGRGGTALQGSGLGFGQHDGGCSCLR